MNIICTKCGSKNVFVDMPEIEKQELETVTMDDLQRNATQGVPLVYHITTYKCGDCGHCVSF